MERKEPSLVPEWLKGATGGATGVISQFPQPSFHQDGNSGLFHSSQRVPPNALSGNSTLDYDSSPHAFSERAIHPSFRRSGNSDGLLEQSGERFSRSRSSFFSSRSSSYRSNGHDLEDWNHDKLRMSRERSKDMAPDFGGSIEKDKDHFLPNPFLFRRQSSEKHIRYAADVPFRRMQSMVRLQKNMGNGGEKMPNEPFAPVISNSVPASSTEKGSFEQNFPSLNSQERLAVQSNFENVALKNSFADERLRIDKNNVVGSDKNCDSIENGILLPDMAATFPSHPMPSSAATEALGSSLNDALKPAKFPVETQQLEELALRQSRQLVPMKPVFPKSAGLSPRDKLKPKLIPKMEPISPATSRITQASSHTLHATRHHELSPNPTHGNLLVPKSGREAAVSNVSLAKPGGTFVPLVANSVMNVAGKMGTTQSSGMTASAGLSKKPKQLLDRRAVPIVPVPLTGADGGNNQQSKELGSASEDKRVSDHAKNRSAFFNALRRKAAGDGSAFNTFHNKNSIVANKVEESSARAKDCSVPKKDDMLGSVSSMDGSEGQKSSINVSIAGVANGTEKDVCSNGLIVEGMQAFVDESNYDDLSPGTLSASGVAGSEEEEAAFLRSLGWQESAKEGEEALTEEEINAFYQEHMSSQALPSLMRQKQRLKTVYRKTVLGSIGSISSGLSSSDSDSDEELNIRQQ